jgi:hypothetical protein
MKLVLTLTGLLATAGVTAQQLKFPQPHMDNWVMPVQAQILDKSACPTATAPDRVVVNGQDQQTLFYSGRVYATAYCFDASHTLLVYNGCADVSWDPTGTTFTYKVLWQDQMTQPTLVAQAAARQSCLFPTK